MSRKRTHAVEFTQYCYTKFGRVKATIVMASDAAYMVWYQEYIETQARMTEADFKKKMSELGIQFEKQNDAFFIAMNWCKTKRCLEQTMGNAFCDTCLKDAK